MNGAGGAASWPPRCATTSLCIVLVWAVVCLPMLGEGGLIDTEGHRALPAWEWLAPQTDAPHDAFVPRLFEQPYLRKPQGMAWAVWLSAQMLGPSELSARLVSALSMLGLALVSSLYGARWFGLRAGLASGLGVVLMPVFWPIARAAEIEMLLLFGTGLAALGAIELLRHGSARIARALLAASVTLGIIVAGLAKGPAAVPTLLAAIAGPIVVFGRASRSGLPALAVAISAGLAALAALGLITASRVSDLNTPAVTQSPTDFLWTPSGALSALLLPFAGVIMAMPVALALLFPWGPDARREPAHDTPHPWPEHAVPTARALSWSFMLGVLVSAAAGLSNPRYVLPVLVLVPPLVGYAVGGLAGGFGPRRRHIARVLALGGLRVWVVLLLVASLGWSFGLEPRRRATSGRDAGERLAPYLPDGSLVLAHDLVEARPETLHYARAAAAREGRSVRIRWVVLDADAIAQASAPGNDQAPGSPSPAVVLIVRDDPGSQELTSVLSLAPAVRVAELGRASVHQYALVALEVVPPP